MMDPHHSVDLATPIAPDLTTFRRSRPDYLLGSEDLLTNAAICDLKVFSVDGAFIKMPSVLLAAISPFLKEVLTAQPILEDSSPCLITEISQEDLVAVVNFAATGCLPGNVTSKVLESFHTLGLHLDDLPCSKQLPDQPPLVPVFHFPMPTYNMKTEGGDGSGDPLKAIRRAKKKAKKRKKKAKKRAKKRKRLEEQQQLNQQADPNAVPVANNGEASFDPNAVPSGTMDSDVTAAVTGDATTGELSPKKARMDDDDNDFDDDSDDTDSSSDSSSSDSSDSDDDPTDCLEMGMKQEPKKPVELSEEMRARLEELKAKGISYFERIPPGEVPENKAEKMQLIDLVAPWNFYPVGDYKRTKKEIGLRCSQKAKFECMECSYRAETTLALEQHLTHHRVKGLDRDYFYCYRTECLQRFGTLAEWKVHSKEAHNDLVFICFHCNKEFSNYFWRRNHVERIHSRGGKATEFKCAHCGREFKCKTTYNRHMKHESTYHSNLCLYKGCGFKFNSWNEHVNHVNAIHNQLMLYVCGICPEVFATKPEKIKHRYEHHPEQMQKSHKFCDLCGKSLRDLEKHMALIHGQDKPGHCSICGLDFPSIYHHRQQAHISGNREVPCPTCGMLVKSDQMVTHICGLKQNDYLDCDLEQKRCKICGASFPTMTAIVDHMRISHIARKPMGGRYQCPKCAAQFDTKQHLRDHNLVHLSDKTLEKFQCPHCPKISNSRKSRSQHIFTAHKRRFYCKVCYARFRTEEELGEHTTNVRCVRKPRPMLSCDTCGKVLKRQLMAKHILINHTPDSEKPFQCTYCPKGFAEKLTWEEHLNTHTNSKPFSCATCGWAFNSRRAMLAHEVHKHGRPKMIGSQVTTAPTVVQTQQHP